MLIFLEWPPHLLVASARAIAPLQVRRSPPNVAPHRLGSPRARLHRASPRVPALSPPTVARRRPYAEHGLPTKMYGINMATSRQRPEPRPVRAGLPGPSLAKGFICPPGLPRGHLDRLRGKALYPQIVLQVATSYVQSLYIYMHQYTYMHACVNTCSYRSPPLLNYRYLDHRNQVIEID